MESTQAADVVSEYLTAFYTGDFERAATVVAEDFSFQGPFLAVDGKDAFFAGAQGLRPIVRGHQLLRQWEEGGEVCSVYEASLETPLGRSDVRMAEWHVVRDGRLVSGRVIFDTVPFRALLPAR